MLDVKVYYKDGSIEARAIPSRKGVSSSVFYSNEGREVTTSDNDDVPDVAERFYIDADGVHLERGTLSMIGAPSSKENIIVGARNMNKVKKIVVDGEQVWPEQAEAEDSAATRFGEAVDALTAKIGALDFQ